MLSVDSTAAPGSSLHLTLYRVDPSRNMFRFYRLDIQPDLFGNHCLIREWGRIGRSGQVRSVPFPTGEAAQYALHKQRAVKERKGYAT
jgi:predicted DNA-binding WGR domain protein